MRSAKGLPSGAIVGFANFLLRLWESEQPRTVMVGWDCVGEPTYRLEAFPAYQSGRVFDPELLEQLDLLPELVRALGFVAGKQPGYEADDFLAAAVAQEEARGGETLVATSDRDAFQLVSERTTVLQPVRGVSELARIGPAEVRERYGVDPAQVPDFIALRGDPSDKLPGAKGVGPKTAATLLAEYGTLEAMLDAGRFSAQREELRPLPANSDDGRLCPSPLPGRSNSQLGRGVHHCSVVGAREPGRAVRGAGLVEVVSHAALAELHPTEHHPEIAAAPRRAARGGRPVHGGRAGDRRAGRALPHRRARRPDPRHRRTDLARRRHAGLGDELRSGPARGRRRDPGGPHRRLRARPAARPPRARRPGDGLLPLQQRRDRGARRRRPSTASSGSRSSTGTSTTGTARRTSSGTTRASSTSRSTSGRSTPAPAARARATRRPSTSRCRRARATRSTSRRSRRSSSPPCARFEPDLLIVSAGFDAHTDDPLASMR